MSVFKSSRNFAKILTWIVFMYFCFYLSFPLKRIILRRLETQENTVVFHTGFYYNTSTFYNKNTFVFLFFADLNLGLSDLWTCNSFSNNDSNVLTTALTVKPATRLTPHCPWTTFLAECTVLAHPDTISLSFDNSPQAVTLPFELPDRKPRGIVSCFAPMFFEERWHTIVLTHELYAHWGVDLQVHYVQSVASEILTLLQPLVSKKLLEIRAIDLPDYGTSFAKKFGYKTYEKTDWRQQVMAIQDCYFRYRESAEFIIIADADDVFVPTKGANLYDEFKYWQYKAPLAAAFEYTRQLAFGKAASSIETFSVGTTLESIRVIYKNTTQKSVYQPKFTEVPWIHWVEIARGVPFKISLNDSLVMHLALMFDPKEKLPRGIPLTQYVDILNIVKPNSTVINYEHAAKTLKKLPKAPTVYAGVIKECYDYFYLGDKAPEEKRRKQPFCPTPTICEIPKRDISCHIAVRSYETNCINGETLCVVIPSGPVAKYVQRHDGCAWGDVH